MLIFGCVCLYRLRRSLVIESPVVFFFFFQAEDGIRDSSVTGVQTCALPICRAAADGTCLCTYAYRRGVRSVNVARPATMLTCRSCTNFFVQGDFSSARSRAALRLLVLLLKLSHAESTLTQPTLIDSRTRSPPMSFGPEAISRSISASRPLPTSRRLRRV